MRSHDSYARRFQEKDRRRAGASSSACHRRSSEAYKKEQQERKSAKDEEVDTHMARETFAKLKAELAKERAIEEEEQRSRPPLSSRPLGNDPCLTTGRSLGGDDTLPSHWDAWD